ncbi:uncharacterized protein LOC113003145 [Solenopsis invicta]|uniref:uncharacterized protein LOC113003145 n=1 Tax=Solenopsis invicta TaxID=13686 RepID=UPI00193CFF2B|nr:uncharacterized protein LOC113003145 [Solenopsis invicta]
MVRSRIALNHVSHPLRIPSFRRTMNMGRAENEGSRVRTEYKSRRIIVRMILNLECSRVAECGRNGAGQSDQRRTVCQQSCFLPRSRCRDGVSKNYNRGHGYFFDFSLL